MLFNFNNRKNLSCNVDDAMRLRVLVAYNYKCHYCRVGVTAQNAHIDHSHPVSRGGLTIFENLRASCMDCNLEKGDKTEREYVAWKMQQRQNHESSFLARLLQRR
jgi:5-methylcytosine-specific restriction endonuclease McrA